MSDSHAQEPAQDWTGRTLELDIERVAHGGHCVARSDGRVVFVRHTLPGERVRAVVTEDGGGSFCRADAVEVIEAAPGRVAPPCEYAVPGGCGGCDWQHADPATQRELKRAVVAEQLQRLAGIDWDGAVEDVAPGPLHWRTRMQYAVDGDTVGLREHRSARVIPIERCLIAEPDVDVTVAAPYADRPVTSVELAAGERPVVAQTVDRKRRRHTVSGGDQMHHVRGRDFQVSAGGFWQVHPTATDVLAGTVSEYADAQPGERVLDLYSGVGLFAATLGEQVGQSGSVLALEGHAGAVRDARHNLHDLPQARSERLDVRAAALQRRLGDDEYDVTVLDPPRSGAKPALCEVIARRTRRVIVYVACDPAALARDLAAFADAGWRLADLRAFDLFPMTHHVECVARLVPAG
ncbi:TRAM domain-containing protein [Epidermidibacterium keratini]|uniref:TRAM domain-containing protein n=1 Tax=Epidermidibacterium keratini TaxID=1891644 RepID=A0A7L4YS26_9ACTN|nr:TRAM domain-containing protein [Epidermidibacterium keratini]QHC01966.1 TRAM domain-containing protein [Epidermidibacterium keratini]